jgi:hypothetical protein
MIAMPPSEEVREHDLRWRAHIKREIELELELDLEWGVWPQLRNQLMRAFAHRKEQSHPRFKCAYRADYGACCVNDHLVPLTRWQAAEFFGLELIEEIDSRRRTTRSVRQLTEAECPHCQLATAELVKAS